MRALIAQAKTRNVEPCRQSRSPEPGRNGDGGDVAVPALPHAFYLAQDVTHDLPPRTLCCDAVLRPLGQILQVERQIVLHGSGSVSAAKYTAARD